VSYERKNSCVKVLAVVSQSIVSDDYGVVGRELRHAVSSICQKVRMTLGGWLALCTSHKRKGVNAENRVC
jgi:hypothetical protein